MACMSCTSLGRNCRHTNNEIRSTVSSAIYLMIALMLCGLSVFCTIIVLCVRHHHPTQSPPAWLLRMGLRLIGNHRDDELCLSKQDVSGNNVEVDGVELAVVKSTANNGNERPGMTNHPESKDSERSTCNAGPCDSNHHAADPAFPQPADNNHHTTHDLPSLDVPEPKSFGREYPVAMDRPGATVKPVASANGKEVPCCGCHARGKSGKGKRVRQEWEAVGVLLDRVFFVVFLVATLVVSIVLFLVYPLYAPESVEPIRAK
jgi:uncharacterized membrane protein YhaH (DUF805 family)